MILKNAEFLDIFILMKFKISCLAELSMNLFYNLGPRFRLHFVRSIYNTELNDMRKNMF